MEERLSAEALRRAASRPGAPPRLTRIADAVLEGKLSWEDAVNGQSEHPAALALFTPKARETAWPLVHQAAAEIEAEADGVRPEQDDDFPVLNDEDEYFKQFRVLRPAFDMARPRW
ncbi:hypothetical protein [Amycolatopsis taiwanensis]|uniref:Uncharacterized protein n=1 Tax=Amycolatopsis taiwanensis TaxID=342230 RepID=A0A9W6RAR5_9PSEU|nr:hypothetical protein [Amycolatopsis taiwanensis]GLY70647.1 hypothetical protein Atai01_72660 [Amycolatopsis taiwanensis]